MKITNEYVIYMIFLLEITACLTYLYVISINLSKEITNYIKEPEKLTQKRLKWQIFSLSLSLFSAYWLISHSLARW